MSGDALQAKRVPRTAKWITLAVLLLLLLVTLLASAPPVGAAARWSDVPKQMLKFYDVTAQELAAVDPGNPNGTWGPAELITRGWIARKGVTAFAIPLTYPAAPTFSDVPAGDPLYPYVEAAVAAVFMNGYSDSTFLPGNPITRVHAALTIARWTAYSRGYDLAAMYSEQRMAQIFAAYPDSGLVHSMFRPAIAFALDSGILRADANGQLSPYVNATKIEVAAMIVHALAVPVAQSQSRWSDVPKQMLRFYDVTGAQLATIDPGYPNRTWGPSEAITRGWLAREGVTALQIPLLYPEAAQFTDVPPGDPLYPYVEGASAVGFMNGYAEGTFGPSDPISRVHAALTVARWAARAKGYDLTALYSEQHLAQVFAAYPDGNGVHAMFRQAIAFALDSGILRADADGRLSPYVSATKIEVAAMLLHALEIPVAQSLSRWSDLSRPTLRFYDITAQQLVAIDPGYPNRTWGPAEAVSRGWLACKGVTAFQIPLLYPETAQFTDVPLGDPLLPYVEGAVAATFMNGRTADTFVPNDPISRMHAAVTIARWVCLTKGYDIVAMYTDEQVAQVLAAYPDGDAVLAASRRAIVFALDYGILRADAGGYLSPNANTTKIEAAAMIVHAVEVPAAN